jgi:hypothetical protein
MLKTSSGGQSSQTALAGLEKKLTGRDPDDSAIPPTVRKAVRFMLAGAAVTIVFALFQVIVEIVNRNALDNVGGKPPSSSQLAARLAFVIVGYAIVTWIWVLMARLNRAGLTWARIAASVLFAIVTLELYIVVDSIKAGQVLTVADIIYIVFLVGIWVAGVGAIAMLWRPQSSAYFKARKAER